MKPLGLAEPAGEMARRLREWDWAASPLGSRENWPQSLELAIAMILSSGFPMAIRWGPDLVMIYNDAYRPILGTKHPRALGQPFGEVWPEIDHILRPLIDAPFKGGPATWMDEILLEVNRHGFTEETHFTIAYSPVPDETVPRGIGGVIATVHETTDKIIGERRIAALRALGSHAGE
jgi:hypothetical protein